MEDQKEIEDKEEVEKQPDAVNFHIERYIPENLVAHYSDAMTVLHSKNEFIVSFFQTEYPAASNTEELAAIKSVKGRCVSRVIMSPEQTSAVIQALQVNLDKYRKSYESVEVK